MDQQRLQQRLQQQLQPQRDDEGRETVFLHTGGDVYPALRGELVRFQTYGSPAEGYEDVRIMTLRDAMSIIQFYGQPDTEFKIEPIESAWTAAGGAIRDAVQGARKKEKEALRLPAMHALQRVQERWDAELAGAGEVA